jgi:hypothetical protein
LAETVGLNLGRDSSKGFKGMGGRILKGVMWEVLGFSGASARPGSQEM